MVVVLFLVNLLAVQREHAAKAAATASLQLADATNEVRFQMMQNRFYLSNYLLSGDSREVDRMNEGLRTLTEKLQQGKIVANSEQERSALDKVEQQLEQAWSKEFAQPLIEKAQGRGLRQRHRRRIADLLPSEGRFLLGEEFHGRSGCGRRENRKLVDAGRKSDDDRGALDHRRLHCQHLLALTRRQPGSPITTAKSITRTADQSDDRVAADRRHWRSGTQHRS
jgi:hypothetical protein